MPNPASVLAILLAFAAMVLLLFVSVSAPTWDKVYFLNVNQNGGNTHYGCFGFTGSKPSVGYFFNNGHLNSTILHNLTKTLILHPIACGLAFFALLAGLCGAFLHRRSCMILMALLAGLAGLVTFVAWVIDMILFGIARQRYRNIGSRAQYGNATWLTLGALVALWLAVCAASAATLGRQKRSRRRVGNNAVRAETGAAMASGPASQRVAPTGGSPRSHNRALGEKDAVGTHNNYVSDTKEVQHPKVNSGPHDPATSRTYGSQPLGTGASGVPPGQGQGPGYTPAEMPVPLESGHAHPY